LLLNVSSNRALPVYELLDIAAQFFRGSWSSSWSPASETFLPVAQLARESLRAIGKAIDNFFKQFGYTPHYTMTRLGVMIAFARNFLPGCVQSLRDGERSPVR
jgi:hypothetical protein